MSPSRAVEASCAGLGASWDGLRRPWAGFLRRKAEASAPPLERRGGAGAVIVATLVLGVAAGETLLPDPPAAARPGERVRLGRDPRVWRVIGSHPGGLLEVESRGYKLFVEPGELRPIRG